MFFFLTLHPALEEVRKDRRRFPAINLLLDAREASDALQHPREVAETGKRMTRRRVIRNLLVGSAAYFVSLNTASAEKKAGAKKLKQSEIAAGGGVQHCIDCVGKHRGNRVFAYCRKICQPAS